MNKARYFLAVLIALMVFTGCIIPGARKERAEIELQRNDSLFVVDEGDFRFRIVLPKDLLMIHKPVINFHETNNKLSITCGPAFHIVAHMSDSAMGLISQHDGIFSHNILDNEDESIVYARILPDGTIYDYGLCQQTELNGRNYHFKTDENGEFSLDNVLRMKLALASVKI